MGNSDSYPLVMTPELGVIIAIVVVGVAIPWVLARCKSPAKEEDTDETRLSWRCRWNRAGKEVKRGLHFEVGRRPTIRELMDQHSEKKSVRKDGDKAFDADDRQAGERQRNWSSITIGPGAVSTEAEIRSYYPSSDDIKNDFDRTLADRVVLVLRLSLALLASGHCTVDAETTAMRVASALKVPAPRISIGHRLLTAQFGSFPVHVLTCERDFVFSTLADLQSFAESIICGEILPDDIGTALRVCDAILEQELPYGWIVYDLTFWAIGPWAAIAAYYGTYWDMLGAACISPFTVLTYRVCHRLRIKHLENILVPFVLGLVTPLVWRYISNGGQDLCHITPQYMAALLIHLPGAEIVWGVLEILQGSVVHGSSRLVKGLVSAISLATFVTLGWQVFGRDLASGFIYDANGNPLPEEQQTGTIASLPDSSWCPTVPPYGDDPDYPQYFSWPLIIGVYNIPLNILCLINVFIPMRSWLGPFIVGQVGLLVLGFLQFQCTPDTCELPGIIQNVLAALAATWVAMAVEVVQGLPSAISIIPVLFIFAPGSAAVLASIGIMHVNAGDVFGTNTSSWTSLTMQAFSYGVGIYLGQEVWSSVMKVQFRKRAEKASAASGYLHRLGQDFRFREGFHSPQNMHGNGKLTQSLQFTSNQSTMSGSDSENNEDIRQDHNENARQGRLRMTL